MTLTRGRRAGRRFWTRCASTTAGGYWRSSAASSATRARRTRRARWSASPLAWTPGEFPAGCIRPSCWSASRARPRCRWTASRSRPRRRRCRPPPAPTASRPSWCTSRQAFAPRSRTSSNPTLPAMRTCAARSPSARVSRWAPRPSNCRGAARSASSTSTRASASTRGSSRRSGARPT